MTEAIELLFFDTFAHENSEELNLDLVQFPKPVYITEVRIIPLGARVQADFPGGVRLGATNPSQFQIEFFVNDLGKPGASTFESLGGFEYNQNGCINLECSPNESVRKIPTDGLVLRGWYTTITLAVYGTLTVNIAEQIMPAVVTPSLPAQANTIPDVVQQIGAAVENEWQAETVQAVGLDYTQTAATPSYQQTYPQPENYPEYSDYYTEVPKDPRAYHHTPEVDWERKSRARSSEVEKDRERDRERDRGRDLTYQKTGSLDRDHSRSEDRRDRDRDREKDRDRERERDKDRDRERDSRCYSRSHSRDRDRQTSRDRDWEHERERLYKHQDGYRRRDERDERKRPRTPPPKRPHTPHSDHKEASPCSDGQNVNEEELVHPKKQKNEKEIPESEMCKDIKGSPMHEDIVEEFEPILSDEDIIDDAEHYSDLDYDYSAYTNNDDLIKLFVPGVTELRHYEKKAKLILINDKIEISDNLKIIIGIADDFFKSSITKYTLETFERCNTEIKEEFIHLCEKVYSIFEDVSNFCDIVKFYTANLKQTDQEALNQSEYVITTLVDWLKVALNYKMANSQEQPGYKIRHIKCGVRLAEWCCNSLEFVKILWQHNILIHDILLDLYEQEYMALSIKLMILRALDTYLLKKQAIECFLSSKLEKENGFFENISVCNTNGYLNLVEHLRKNPSVRLKFAISSILKKINFFEVLHRFESSVTKLRSDRDRVLHTEVNLVIKTLEQIVRTLQAGPLTFSQHKRFLPVMAQFEINRMDCRNVLIDFLEMFNVLQCFVVLLTLPLTMNISLIKAPIYEILSELLVSPEGLKYLSKNSETINVLVKYLLQNDEEVQYIAENVESKSYQLGVTIAYSLQCFYHVERLRDIGQRCKYDCNAFEVIDELHSLFCLTFSNIGKHACVRVLSMDEHINCLLQFLDVLSGKEKSESQITKLKKSPAIGYIVDLLANVIINESNIPFLETYSKQLMNIIAHKDIFEATISEKLNDLHPFLKPFENINNSLNYDNISSYVEIINKNLENVINYPGHLITSLRIIQHLGIAKKNNKYSFVSEDSFNNYVELKYKHVILQLFSLDGVSLLTKLLQKICEHYEQPSLHTATFASNCSIGIVSVIQPAVKLLKQMLKYVIQCRNMLFKDLTSVPVLLQTYSLVHSLPASSPVYFKVAEICKEIIETLLVYSQPLSEEVHENDSLNKTLWTLMCGEVIKYIFSAPYTFISGLLIFSELLPLPLPIQSQEDLAKIEMSKGINLRKLWSAHLHPHSNSIQELINKLCVTSHQPLLNLLRRVCVQLSDLAANTAIMIARGVLDTVYNALSTNNTEKTVHCNGNTARLLNFLACLLTHNPIKCAILQLIQNNTASSSNKNDEKYPGIVILFVQVLKTKDASNFHVQAQECILSMIQSFCDSEITLLQLAPDEKTELTSEMYLANALPTKETFVIFINAMIDHVMGDYCFITFLPIVRTMLLLTEHNYGFYHLCECLAKRTAPLSNILNKLVNQFSKDNNECLSTLNALIEFLRVCPSLYEADANLIHAPRSIRVSVVELKNWIGWSSNDNEKNSMNVLEELLKNLVQEDNTFEGLLEGLSGVIKSFNSVNNEEELKDNHIEPVLPPPESLLMQFSGRQIYTTADSIDDRLTSNYWLSPPPATDENDADVENIPCDLSDLSKQLLPSEINLIREVEKLCRISSSQNLEQGENKEKRNDQQKDKMKRPFVTPMRGRGFPRAVQQRSDLFRSRPPNTSRPPSLHVDDFVALETCGAQPTGPTGYNKISRELLATTRLARGVRGRAFVTSERAMQYRQMAWWSTGMTRGVYQ